MMDVNQGRMCIRERNAKDRRSTMNINRSAVERAAKLIVGGKLVAFPTETVYGIGANAFDEKAVAKIFLLKGRPASDPIIVHIHGESQMHEVARDIPSLAMDMARAFWPGPLTMILWRNPRIPENVSSGLPTVAVRLPNHPVAIALLVAAGVPIAAPSANLFSRPSSTVGRHVIEDFGSTLDLVLDGGEATLGIESTVVDLTGTVPTVLRPGGLTMESLREIVPNVRVRSSYVSEQRASSSPGMLLKHYSPRAKLLLFSGDHEERVLEEMVAKAMELRAEGARVGVLATSDQSIEFSDRAFSVFDLGDKEDTNSIARSLYDGMRRLDSEQVNYVLVSAPRQHGLGLALWDRLYRAAEGHIIFID